jgi:TPR repeat protein
MRSPGWRSRLIAAGITIAVLATGGYWMLRLLEPPDNGPRKQAGETDVPKEVPKQERTLEELARMPWDEAAPYFQDWVARGHFDDAFALLRSRVAQDQSLPAEETYRFAQDLLGRGRLNEAFALLQVIATNGHSQAALAVGEMYDPLHWAPTSSPFSSPNPRKAQAWYRRALELGAEAARSRLEALESWKPEPGAAGKDAG